MNGDEKAPMDALQATSCMCIRPRPGVVQSVQLCVHAAHSGRLELQSWRASLSKLKMWLGSFQSLFGPW